MKQIILILLCCLSNMAFNLFAQDDPGEEIEIIVIDSYISPKPPYEFILSFFTLIPVKSNVVIDNKYSIVISDELNEDHAKRISMDEFEFDSLIVPFYIEVFTDSIRQKSEIFTLEFLKDEIIETSTLASLFHLCIGGIVFLVPSVGMTNFEGDYHFNLGKEVTIYNFYSGGYNYPVSYVSIEYTHTFGETVKNILRSGYKRIFEVPVIEFISPGITLFTNFKSVNGFSPEITFGLFKLSNVFTVYSRYRYNFKPGGSILKFQEISFGLYSHFFSLNF